MLDITGPSACVSPAAAGRGSRRGRAVLRKITVERAARWRISFTVTNDLDLTTSGFGPTASAADGLRIPIFGQDAKAQVFTRPVRIAGHLLLLSPNGVTRDLHGPIATMPHAKDPRLLAASVLADVLETAL